ncbi:lipoyl synthase [Desulfovibrio sp. UCD-KL4C]|uniref:lipoyl synthase n=1 Tax=Desulfovibrio sp. UCD-KL4C TaxID=2578120 RepID=UPI0025B93C0E|nr:lipoyl synthase [Desulfovibrio sp. UCD-KL4C]
MKKPNWLVIPAPNANDMDRIQALLGKGQLHSVCESAQCPNIGECFANKTCTFMILGDVCTRNCAFCAVTHGKPSILDVNEPDMVALTAKQLGLKHVVVTSVTRDDLPDGGAEQFAATIRAIKRENPESTVEVLIPDFGGQDDPLKHVLEAGPHVLNHNLETVPRIYPSVRPGATYERSLKLLSKVPVISSDQQIMTKSGLMLGLGETQDEIIDVMKDLLSIGCRTLTLGQYLRPSALHHPVLEYVHPDKFKQLSEIGKKLGFRQVVSGPLVRSSYHAAESFAQLSA